MRYRMNLQLFDDGGGAGSGNQGGTHPEHMEPEHIPMNSWKRLQVHE